MVLEGKFNEAENTLAYFSSILILVKSQFLQHEVVLIFQKLFTEEK